MQVEPNLHIGKLLAAHSRGELSDAERQELLAWVNADPANKALYENMGRADFLAKELDLYYSFNQENARQKIRAHTLAGRNRVRSLRRLQWAAALILLVAGAGAYLWNSHKKSTSPAVVTVLPAEIPPGREGAVLTLNDGRQLVLDSLGNGVIAVQNGTEIVLKDGRLAYDQLHREKEATYNTVTTPKGRQFSLILPDGSQVWLNAASSIRYPTRFTGTERRVEITGEVYFEITGKGNTPFRVNVDQRTMIEVLGTQFNVNAYRNEGSVKTTLLEGRVKLLMETAHLPSDQNSGLNSPASGPVANQTARRNTNQPANQNNLLSGNTVVLKPGQQAQIADDIRVLSGVDTDKVMAWRNGLFNFEDASLEEIMRQLERWYDIDVVYEGEVPDVELTGKLTRGVTLNDLLPGLEKMGVKYRLEGRKLTVLK